MLRPIIAALALTAAAAVFVPEAGAFPPVGTPTTTSPGLLSGTGIGSDAIFVFSDAGDTSTLDLTGFGGNPIFNNSSNVSGNVVGLGALAGPQQFGLNNLTQGTAYLADVADPDGNYHALYTTNYADFGVGAMPAAAAAVIGALPPGTSVVFIGWEDRNNNAPVSDWDYNDLIFAFTNLDTPILPEPASLALLGFGLAGLGVLRRRK